VTILANIALAGDHIFQVLGQYSWVLPQYLQVLSKYLQVLSRWIGPWSLLAKSKKLSFSTQKRQSLELFLHLSNPENKTSIRFEKQILTKKKNRKKSMVLWTPLMRHCAKVSIFLRCNYTHLILPLIKTQKKWKNI